MPSITPFLWFNNNAEEALTFYTSVFKEAEIGKVVRYGDAGPGPAGSLMTATFTLNGQKFIALNGGPHYKFTEAISFVINCQMQEEVDYYWEKLADGGEPGRCGWLKDQFGLSWQVVPDALAELLKGADAAKSQNVMQALMQMGKIDIAVLQEAYMKG
ncbi:VOC family protein [Mucilaginibacter sp. Bleaf8]|uniref:VOC family protein n=1 Tax=Mucilaginibacter sp. Bleaf8 TaxID=2834430 RepID=UPI001BCB33D2|nr:VOC family protein [Mucilaginibacter sp. Bleaf8]MBS7563600.1 VOC family protein [Mucilaginibacter sp. Bleaf8]